MARISGTTALRAALGGIAGGLRGLGAMREEQRLAAEQERERKRQEMLDERQRMLDRSMLQREGYEETGAMDRLRAGGREATFRTVFGPPEQRRPGDARAVAAALESAMPRQTMELGGVQYERTSPRALELRQAEQEQMREQNKRLATRQERDAERASTLDAARRANLDPDKVELLLNAPPAVQSVLAARLFPAPQQASRRIELSDEEEEAAGRAFIAANSRNPKLASALNAAFAQDPAMAQRPGQTAYRLMKRGAVPKVGAATKGYEPPKPQAERDRSLLKGIGLGMSSTGELTEEETEPTAAPAPRATPAAPAYDKQQDQEYLDAVDAIINLQAPRGEVIRMYQERTGRKWPGML